MKTILIALITICTLAISAVAQTTERLTLPPGKQVTSKKSKLKIKLVEVSEDSRCPTGAQCVWAGRAIIKLSVTSPRMGTKVIEIDTSKGPQGDQFDGWAISLDSLTPHPNAATALDPKSYRAKVTVTRLQR